jgi:hypothetical protein
VVEILRTTSLAPAPDATWAGANENSLRDGKPLQAKVTLLGNVVSPATGSTRRLYVAISPAWIVRALVLVLNAKSNVTTLRETICDLADGAPAVVAEIIIGNVPIGVSALVLIVSVVGSGAPALGLTVEGWNMQAAPAGKPVQENATAALNAPKAVT